MRQHLQRVLARETPVNASSLTPVSIQKVSHGCVSNAETKSSKVNHLYPVMSNCDTFDLITLCSVVELREAIELSIDTGQGSAIYGLLLDVAGKIERIDERSESTLEQAKATNGRVTSLENRVSTLENERSNFRASIRLVWVAVALGGAALWELVKFYFDHFVVRK
jgi:hypothetical protein